jgi:plasmid stability protein
MAVLNIRNLPATVHRKLRIRAAEHGRSMESEARAILTEVCGGEEDWTVRDLPDLIAGLYGGNPPAHGVDDLIAERREEAKKED